MRVLHLQHFVYPYRFPLFEEIARSVQLDVYFCRDKRRGRQWDVQMPPRRTFGARILRAFSVGPLTLNPGLLWALRKRYDVYSVAGLDTITLLQFLQIYLISRLRRVPFILIDEFIDTAYYRTNRRVSYAVNKAIRRIFYQRIDAFVLWNRLGLEWAVRLGARRDRVFCGPQVLANERDGFAPDEAERLDAMNAWRGDKKKVLFVGRLIELKGIDVLIEAFKKCEDEDIELVIVGNGPCEAALREIAGEDHRISFRGYLEGVQKRDEYKSADVFVLPSLHEPWGFVVNEAIAWGLPIVATTAVGSADFLVNGNGYVVQAGDREALGRALQHLLTDREFNQRCREASIRLSQQFHIRDMAAPFLDATKRVLHGG